MSEIKISDSVRYVGCNDHDIDLFESQYCVPDGVSYNSYIILDEKIAIMDTVDRRKTEEWLNNVAEVLGDRQPDYLVVSHLEPDHAANIQKLCERYPSIQVVSNAMVHKMIPQFFTIDLSERQVVVKEGDTLSLGSHTLAFVMAPMVHWPEVMVEYEVSEKILFSADGFGKFGALDVEQDWTNEARRYFINIVGKYGAQVQALLKKAATLDIQTICPLHGPILKENLGFYLGKYDTWSSYRAEEKGIVVAYASIHGNTAKAAQQMADILRSKGEENVVVYDLSRSDMAQVIADAYRYDRMIVASVTYDGSLFPFMEDFLYHLKIKNFQNRKIGIMQNGSWAPMAGKYMTNHFDAMKNITLAEPTVTIHSTVKPETVVQMEALADAMIAE